MKDHRFNRLFDCAMSVHYHLGDKREYLETYSNIVNQVAIIDKSFLEIEILKPILTATVLRGILGWLKKTLFLKFKGAQVIYWSITCV